ncbi:hypothetical protein ACHAXR_012174 [Thalassiosira sp. AJA248-18]
MYCAFITKSTRCVKNNERQTTRSWSADEDAKLAKLVGNAFDVARISWNLLAHQIPSRSGKQCRERYINNLKPDRKKGGWSKEEDSIIVRMQAELNWGKWPNFTFDIERLIESKNKPLGCSRRERDDTTQQSTSWRFECYYLLSLVTF